MATLALAKQAIYIHSSVVQPTMSGLWLAYDNRRLAMASGQAPSNQTEVIDKFIHRRRSPLRSTRVKLCHVFYKTISSTAWCIQSTLRRTDS